jgi:Zn-dependent protease
MEIALTIFSLIVLLFSVIIHELAHGSVAFALGDPTAKYEGRLTLNPLRHLDPFGSIILPLLLLLATGGQGPIFGWAKPVPINPYNFKDQKWGTLKVAVAGPATNFLIAIIFGLFIRFINLPQQIPFIELLGIITIYNFLWGIFNLVPIPPLDGSWILFRFLPQRFVKTKIFLQQYGLFILIFFIFFGGLQGLAVTAQFLYYLITGTAFVLL